MQFRADKLETRIGSTPDLGGHWSESDFFPTYSTLQENALVPETLTRWSGAERVCTEAQRPGLSHGVRGR